MPNEDKDTVITHRPGATLVVCIGNELVADDAVGYEVFQRLQGMELPKETRVEYSGVGGLSLLDRLTGYEDSMIVVDAVQFGASPGTIHCISWEDLPTYCNTAISAHGIGLKETIDVGKIICPEKLPANIVLIGIEGRCFNRMRDFMTPATAAALSDAAAACMQQITQFQRGS